MKWFSITGAVFLLVASLAWADGATVSMLLATDTGPGKAVGTIAVTDTPYGALFTPDINGLSPGLHGFHVHENADCAPTMKDGKMVPGLAAGGHYDPGKTGKHLGPYGDGHLGDLPALTVTADGTATLPVLAPRLKAEDLLNRSLMIHAGGDNYADTPMTLGGGGARVVCGVIAP